MNSCMGEWGEEEREELPKCFKDDEPFEIKIVTKKNKFKVRRKCSTKINFHRNTQ